MSLPNTFDTRRPRADVPADSANEFEALERSRKLAFAATVLVPKIPEQIRLALCAGEGKEEYE